ncbi:MAG: 23S rRNA (guanosine(2251)-2'-O)-methyltransferase RlmB [Deltaproteobacteria bacterium]|nr:23S rRNA (guanosine(2251)-2'-O)-methyltransferase RlmB [Deltaproteobacteria bacterium]
MNTEILYGIHSVQESIKAGRRSFFEIYIKKDKISKRLEDIQSRAKDLNIQVHRIDDLALKKITGTDLHQGVAVKVSPYPIVGMGDLISIRKKDSGKHFILLLDNVVDPQNLGALIRTALCVGVDGIIITKDRSARLTPAVSRASAGALEHCLISKVTNLSTTIKALKENGVWIAGMDSEASQSVFEADLTISIAVIIGGEDKGIRPLVKKSCDFLVSIPQTGKIDSLNASAAGAVVMYEVFRQRHVLKNTDMT